jgi:ElaA protein
VRIPADGSDSTSLQIRVAATRDLDASTLYRLLALRAEVFVLEQNCVYLDQDGRDLEPDARQLWVQDGDAVLATLRLLHDADGSARIGRVATTAASRGRGLAARLVARALELSGEQDVVLDAQSHLRHWYARFGFVRDGTDFLEDSIPHVPMRRVGVPT